MEEFYPEMLVTMFDLPKMPKMPLWVYNQVWIYKKYKECYHGLLMLITID